MGQIPNDLTVQMPRTLSYHLIRKEQVMKKEVLVANITSLLAVCDVELLQAVLVTLQKLNGGTKSGIQKRDYQDDKKD